MKTFLQKLAAVPVALGLLTAVFAVSCEQLEDQGNELKLSSAEVNVPCEGGAYVLSYTAGAIDETKLVVESSEDWVNSFEVAGGQIVFTVDANNTPNPRKSTVTVSYSVTGAKAEFVVNQAEKPVSFVLTQTEVTSSTVTFDVTAKDEEETYVLMSVDKAYYEDEAEGFGSDDEALIEAVVAQFSAYAAQYQMTLEQFLTEAKVLSKGSQKGVVFEDFEPQTDYLVFALGMYATEDDATITSDVDKLWITTLPVEKIDMTFDITVSNVTASTADMSIVPSLKENYYYPTVLMKKYAVHEDGTDMTDEELAELAQSDLKSMLAFYQMFGYSVEDALAELCLTGDFNDTVEDLVADSEFLVLVSGVDSKTGVFNTDMAKTSFTTEDVEPSDNTFSMTLTPGVNNVSIDMTVTNQEDTYYLACMPTAEYPGDTEIVTLLEEDPVSSKYLSSGNLEGAVIENLEKGTEYTMFVLGYEAGKATTAVTSQEFTTQTPADPSEVTFNFEYTNVTSKGATVTVTATPSNVAFYCDLITADADEEDVKAQMNELIEYYIGLGYIESAADFYAEMVDYGTGSYEYELKPGTMKAFAFGVDTEKGEMVESTIAFGDTFTIPEPEPSKETVELSMDKCYDADALAAKYPGEYDDFKGQDLYMIPITVVPSSENVKTTYQAVYSDVDETITDDKLIGALTSRGKTLKTVQWFLPYDMALTATAVGEDVNGSYTNVARVVVNKSRADVSPVDDFVPSGASVKQQVLPAPENDFTVMKEFRKAPAKVKAAAPSVKLQQFTPGQFKQDRKFVSVAKYATSRNTAPVKTAEKKMDKTLHFPAHVELAK